MKIAGNTFQEFAEKSNKKKVIVFGAGDFLELICKNYQEMELHEKIQYIVDNDREKIGMKIELNGIEKKIYPPEQLLKENPEDLLILISPAVYAYDIYIQLGQVKHLKDTECFLLPLMIGYHNEAGEILVRKKETIDQIPKTIHYFWFSGKKKTSLAEECLKSWKQICPDYEMVEWNTGNYDVTANAYMYQAFQVQNWAYVSDYARLDVVYRYGGIYLDLDVRLLKNLDFLLKHEMFIGFGPLRDIEAAAFGAKQGCTVIKDMMNIYESRIFEPNTSTNLLNVQPVYLDTFFSERGFLINGRYQERKGVALYPRELFSPMDWFTGETGTLEKSAGIHYCAGGWHSKKQRENRIRKRNGYRRLEEMYFGCKRK